MFGFDQYFRKSTFYLTFNQYFDLNFIYFNFVKILNLWIFVILIQKVKLNYLNFDKTKNMVGKISKILIKCFIIETLF